MTVLNWKPKREWWHEGPGFLVIIKHHMRESEDFDGRNLWNVYAYVYPKHPHFQKFQGEEMFQSAAAEMPLHAGPSYCRAHYDTAGKVTAYQVGSDYNHLHDERFRKLEPENDLPTPEVLEDAERLFRWLADAVEGSKP